MIHIEAQNSFDVSCFSRDLIVKYPFQTQWYLTTFLRHFAENSPIVTLKIYDDDNYIGYVIFEVIADTALFLGMKPVLGQEEVTDYGDMVINPAYREKTNEIWQAILDSLRNLRIKRVQLDYAREDSPAYETYKNQATEKIVAPFIDLPVTWDEYLESLDRVDRKELKRKIRRLDSVVHNYTCSDEITKTDFEEFVRLHSLSSQTKKQFMSWEMKNFFWDLITVPKPGWKKTICFLRINNVNAAALLSFENNTTIFGYNSGYDPAHNYYSTGLLLHAHKIKTAIENKKTIYDFMRGNERYKFDLGGKPLRLYQNIIVL